MSISAWTSKTDFSFLAIITAFTPSMSVGALLVAGPRGNHPTWLLRGGDRICDTDASISNNALVLYRTADGYTSPFAKCYRPHLRSHVRFWDKLCVIVPHADHKSWSKYELCKDPHSCAPRTTTKQNKTVRHVQRVWNATLFTSEASWIHSFTSLLPFHAFLLSCLHFTSHCYTTPPHAWTSRFDIATRHSYTSPCPLPLPFASLWLLLLLYKASCTLLVVDHRIWPKFTGISRSEHAYWKHAYWKHSYLVSLSRIVYPPKLDRLFPLRTRISYNCWMVTKTCNNPWWVVCPVGSLVCRTQSLINMTGVVTSERKGALSLGTTRWGSCYQWRGNYRLRRIN
jgi:hypothetical protein